MRGHLSTARHAREENLQTLKRLHDRAVFLVQAIQPTVDLIEVIEHLHPRPGHLTLQPFESLFESPQSLVGRADALPDGAKAVVECGETAVDRLEAMADGIEPPVDRVGAAIGGFEALAQKRDELVILRGRHAATSTPERRGTSSVSIRGQPHRPVGAAAMFPTTRTRTRSELPGR